MGHLYSLGRLEESLGAIAPILTMQLTTPRLWSLHVAVAVVQLHVLADLGREDEFRTAFDDLPEGTWVQLRKDSRESVVKNRQRQCAASSKGEETGTVHRSTPPYDHHNRPLAESSVGRIKPEGYPQSQSTHPNLSGTTEKELCTREKRAGSC